ncbi:MAG: hypothetical protein WCC10_09650 [Tumebacillaceae bacterium]
MDKKMEALYNDYKKNMPIEVTFMALSPNVLQVEQKEEQFTFLTGVPQTSEELQAMLGVVPAFGIRLVDLAKEGK